MRINGDARRDGAVALWLLSCCALVFAIVVVGGVTRLTHSGLSIVEWQPIVGTVPPLDAQDWEEAFAKYRRTPEYLQVNHGMSLAQFKGIFWWEYFHRLLGRFIGLAFFVPFAYFLLRGAIRAPLAWALAGILALGALQGAVGWYMVRSGLVDDPRVSHVRLAAHLGLALLIYAAMLWLALGLLRARATQPAGAGRHLSRAALALGAVVFLMALSGALVAGIRAGHAYNTFPLMNGHLVPPELLLLEPWWRNAFNNMAMVQFNHRALAWLLMLLVPSFWWFVQRAQPGARARLASHALLGALALQVALGIATLLLAVPVPLAAAHQAGAVLLLSAALWSAHELRAAAPPARQSPKPRGAGLPGAPGPNAARPA